MNEPLAVQVADAVVERMLAISKSHSTLEWQTTPSRVFLGYRAEAQNVRGHTISVEVVEWSDKFVGNFTHEATLEMVVSGIIRDTKEPEREVHRLASDIIKTLALKEQDRLGGLVQEITAYRYAASNEFVEQGGQGYVEVNVRAVVRWTHNAP